MNYEESLLNVLYRAGNKGLKLKKISLHIYNDRVSLFSDENNFQEINCWTMNYLRKNAKNKQSRVERVNFGVYRLKKTFQQTLFDQIEQKEEKH